MYFRLNPECYFIKGKKAGAIYDLIGGNVYALEPEEAGIAEKAENNEPVDGDKKFLKELKDLGLGNFYENEVYIEKLRLGSPIEEYQPGHPPQLNRAFLEINNSCNRDCWFCGKNGVKRSLGCMGCNKWNESGEPLSVERWRNLIDQLKDLGCRKLFIGGGDLTLNWKRTLDILDHTKGKFQTYVKLHQSSISQKVLNDLENRAEPLIQLERTDEVPEIDGFFVLPIEPEKLKETKLPEGKKIMLDFVSEAFDALPEDLPLTSKKKIAKTSIYQFFHNVKFHPCLGNSITITFSGNVLPCPMMRSHVFGNVKEKELYEVFWKEKEGMEKFWKMTLDAVENCSECEFRYACNDCRALEEKLTGKWDGKRLCNYDPQEGKWL